MQRNTRNPAQSTDGGFSVIVTFAAIVVLSISSCAVAQNGRQTKTGLFKFALIGDLPYTAEDEEKFPNLIDDINSSDVAFVVHDGDFQADFRGYKDGSIPCSDATFNDRKNLARRFRPPFVLTPGDNDWTDCHYVKSASYDPLERLAKLRQLFFSEDAVFGQDTLNITRQSSGPKYSRFPENLRWTYGDVLFITLHLVGSDNNFGRTREMDAEYAERNAADLIWMREGFDLAKRNGSKALMIIMQANPGFQNTWPETRFRRYMLNSPIKPPEKKTITAYDEFLRTLESEALRFSRPIVLVHGDSHIFRIDKPLLNSQTGRVIENFTRVETFGTPDVHWVLAVADPADPNVFTFKPQIVKKNVLDQPKP